MPDAREHDSERPAGAAGRAAFALAAALAVVAGALRAAQVLARVVRTDGGSPLYDEASHAWAGAEVARAIAQADLPGALLALDRQSVWPFVHSLLLAPAYLAAGTSIGTARLVSVALAAALAPALFAAGLALHRTRGAWIGLAAATLALLAPLPQVFGTLAMLESPGALLLAIAVALHARSAAPGAPATARRRERLAALALAALFFCKFNYGLLWLAPVLVWEWGALAPGTRSRAVAAVRAWAGRGGARHPLVLVLAAGVLVMALIVATGGGEWRLAGARVSVRSPGNLATALLALLVAWTLVRAPSRARAWRAAWFALPRRHRRLLAWGAAPMLAWFVIPYPNHVKEFFGFVMNRDTSAALPLAERLLVYPRAFVHAYAPTPAVGVLVLVLALWPVPPRPADGAPRLVWLAAWIGLLATMAHRYHDERFLVTVAPLLWLAGAARAVALLDALASALAPSRRGATEAAWLLLGAALAAAALAHPPDPGRVRAGRAPMVLHADLAPALDRVLATAAAAPGPSWLLGFSNPLNPGLLRWRALATGVAPRAFPRRPEWLLADAGAAAPAAHSGERVTVALPEPALAAASSGWAGDVAADRAAAARLASSPGAALESDTLLAGMRVRVYRVR